MFKHQVELSWRYMHSVYNNLSKVKLFRKEIKKKLSMKIIWGKLWVIKIFPILHLVFVQKNSISKIGENLKKKKKLPKAFDLNHFHVLTKQKLRKPTIDIKSRKNLIKNYFHVRDFKVSSVVLILRKRKGCHKFDTMTFLF